MTEPFVSSRFLIRERPTAYPHYDLILQDSQGPVFDLNVDCDSYDGHVYIRFEHIEEMARTLGMVTKEDAEALNQKIAELSEKIERLPKAQEELKSGLDDLTARFFDSINTADDSDDSEPSVGNQGASELDKLIKEAEREAKRSSNQ